MAESIWYYARDDREHGPVTSAYLAELARAGQLQPDDLIWREGMEDWRPARVVRGLFASLAESKRASDSTILEGPFDSLDVAPPRHSDDETRRAEQPAFDARAPLRSDSAYPAEPPAPPIHSVAEQAAQPVPQPVGTTAEDDPFAPGAVPRTESLLRDDGIRRLAYSAVAVGLLWALGARGCDSLATRSAVRLEAKAALAEAQFEERWAANQAAWEQQQRQLQAKSNRSAVEEQQLQRMADQLAALNRQRQEEQLALRDGAWRRLANAARRAKLSQQDWSFWREICFFSGAVVMAIGAIAMTWLGRDEDRWLASLLLAALTLGIFVW